MTRLGKDEEADTLRRACACGCGTMIRAIARNGRQLYFKRNHIARMPLVECACGCGQQHRPRVYYAPKRGGRQVSRYRPGHVRGTIPRELQLKGARAAGYASHIKSDVDATLIQRALLARFGSEDAARHALKTTFAIHDPQARRWLRAGARMRRESAERVLAWLAGLPRTPTLSEQRRTRARSFSEDRGASSKRLDASPIIQLLRVRIQDGDTLGFAERAGVADRTIQRLKSGRQRYVTVDVADRICLACGIHIAELYPAEEAS